MKLKKFSDSKKVREGDVGNEFFIVIDGTADVTQKSKNGTVKKVGKLGSR